MWFIVITLVTVLLITLISLPLHVYIRKLSFRESITDLRYWMIVFPVALVVALLVTFSD
ncbi:MAG: hypothetical protein MK357_06175 [SAR202 cluster bacterium]|nr:hypothetical protein [SAR202 cluster bacterium]